MAISDVSPEVVQSPVKRRMRAETYVFIFGVVGIALFGIARFVYEPSYQEKQRAAEAALIAEHTKVCDQLGKPSGTPDQAKCLKLLDALYDTHKASILPDSSEI